MMKSLKAIIGLWSIRKPTRVCPMKVAENPPKQGCRSRANNYNQPSGVMPASGNSRMIGIVFKSWGAGAQ